MWQGNINVSPILSKDAAVNYISKYAAKAESMSSELDKVMLEYAREELDDGGIQSVVTKTLNRLVIERDFSAQEACHQLLHMPMVECSHTFDTINLPIDLTVTRVLRARSRRTEQPNDPNVFRQARRNAGSKLEVYMGRQCDLETISYLDMVKKYQWKPKNKQWEPR